MRKRKWAAIIAVIVVVSGGVGYGLRSAFPPYPAFSTPVVMDEQLWRAMISGPPMAGVFAVLAALIAFTPAIRAASIARESSAREQWWKRAEWALNQAGSSNELDREIANDALRALSEDATQVELDMIWRTLTSFQGGAPKKPKTRRQLSTGQGKWSLKKIFDKETGGRSNA